MSLYTHEPDIGLGFGICGLGPLVQIIIFIILFFELVSLCTAVFLWIVSLFTNVYKFIVSHSWKLTFLEKLSHRGNFLCIHLRQRERKKHRVVCRAEPCVLLLRTIDNFILRSIRSWVSKHHRLCEGPNLL